MRTTKKLVSWALPRFYITTSKPQLTDSTFTTPRKDHTEIQRRSVHAQLENEFMQEKRKPRFTAQWVEAGVAEGCIAEILGRASFTATKS